MRNLHFPCLEKYTFSENKKILNENALSRDADPDTRVPFKV